jgi:hypothetical protein
MADSTQESSVLPPKQWIPIAVSAAITGTLTLLLQLGSETVATALPESVTRTTLLQGIILLSGLCGCLLWIAIQKPRRLQLTRRRKLLWANGDTEPLCPICWEHHNMQCHLDGPIPVQDPAIERWDCHGCFYWFVARQGSDFEFHTPTCENQMKLDARRATT